jgi:N-acylneuraminate cytidylyltransferase
MDVVLHALDALDQQFDTVVLVQPTSPLVEPDDILGALRLHRQRGGPVVSVTLSEHPVEWLYSMDDSLILRNILGTGTLNRRQEAAPAYRRNGAVWVCTPAFLREKRTFVTEDTLGYVIPAERAVDIDTESDLLLAECLVKMPHKPPSPQAV